MSSLGEIRRDPATASLDAIEEWVTSPGYRGCAFVNSPAEASALDDTHRRIIADHKRELQAFLVELIGVADGKPDWMAPALAVLIDGAIVQCTVFGSTEPVVGAPTAVARLVESR